MFTVESDIWKKKENMKKTVVEFEERLSVEVRWQEKLDLVEERDFRKRELPAKYTTKILYR